MELLKKCLVEYIGTFFLVFTVGCVVLFQINNIVSAVAIGFILTVMVYAGGHISGGHYNPAVSLAALIRGALTPKNLIPYITAQLLGGLVAVGLLNYIMALPPEPTGSVFHVPSMIIGEFLFTFALCYVVLLTATSKAVEGNSYYGLAIGSTVMCGIFAVGGAICLGAFNPAVAIALGSVGIAAWHYVVITLVTNLIAGAFAALIFKFVEYKSAQ